ncbi:MAG: 5'-nucleotidase C-terminal domain-containing protein [Gemmatimonadaceae bacterium]|nr:5'-nucleotidase C-terminal domain-containing protein [Gemmatimonadaceae bacterium]
MERALRPVLATRGARTAALALAVVWSGSAGAQGAARHDLTIAATTDVHGRLRGWDYYANAPDPARTLAGAATIVDSLRAANPGRVLLVDGGDLLQGNPLLFVAAKVKQTPVHPVIAAMNAMQYDAAVLGNHEFNYGVPLLRRALSQASFPFLAANVREGSGRAFVAPYTIVTRTMARGQTVRVGIVGGTTPGSMVWDADHLKAARVTVTDIIPAVRNAVQAVRQRNADVVIVLLHSGLNEPATYDTVATRLPSENVAARVPREIDGIDLVVYGHSHRELVDSTINGALLMQPRNWAASVGVATLTLERAPTRGRWKVVAKRGQSVRVQGHAESPRVLAATATSHAATVAWVTAPVGRTAVRWGADSARVADVPVIDFINEVMRRESGAQLSATAAFSLDASLDTGAITLAALSKLYPYDNTLRAVKISGAQLRGFIEHAARFYRTLDASGRAPSGGIVDPGIPGYNFDIVSGVDYVLDLSKSIGSRVTQLRYQGAPVAPADSFTMALNNYRAGGGGGFAMLAGAPVVFNKDVDIRQLLIDEVRRVSDAGGTLDPARYSTRNWRIEPAAAVTAAFSEQRRARATDAAGTPANSASAATTSRPPATASRPPAGRVLRVIAFSDFHGALEARTEASGRVTGGAVALSAAVRQAERECTGECQSVLVHAGDLFSGTPASDWAGGLPTVAAMNRFNIAAGALGNHEFDFGQDTLRQRLAALRHPLLAVNVRDRSNRIPSWIRADTIVTRGTIRVGIVGAAGTHTATSTKRRNVSDLTFLEPAPLMSERIRSLRASGAHVVIGVIHDGARCQIDRMDECTGTGLDVARQLTEKPDALIIGHAHVNLSLRINGFPVVEPSSSGRALQIVDIPLDGREATAQLRAVNGALTAGADPVVDSIVRAAVARVTDRMQRPVATIAQPMKRDGNQYELGNLIADAARVMGNGDVGMWNNGGIRSDVPAGTLRYGDVHLISPFGNVLVRLRLRGAALREAVERGLAKGRPDVHVSGLLVDYDFTKPRGQRVVRLTTADGTPVDPTRVYSLIINDFMLDDPEGALDLAVISTEPLPIRDIDAFATYFARQPQPLRGDTSPRFRDAQQGGAR